MQDLTVTVSILGVRWIRLIGFGGGLPQQKQDQYYLVRWAVRNQVSGGHRSKEEVFRLYVQSSSFRFALGKGAHGYWEPIDDPKGETQCPVLTLTRAPGRCSVAIFYPNDGRDMFRLAVNNF